MNAGPRLDLAALRLVAITDSLRGGVDGLVARAAAAVAGGATMLQLRLKDESPRTLVEVARRLREAVPMVPVLVNDRADVALAAGVAGVHLGVDDMAAWALRPFVPDEFVIGVSVVTGAPLPNVEGADYLMVGPMFAQRTDPPRADLVGLTGLAAMLRDAVVPVVGLGGITLDNAGGVVMAGAAGIALISELLGASDPMTRARAFRGVLGASGR